MSKTLVLLCLVLVACGGGGGGSTSTPTALAVTYRQVTVAHPFYTVQQIAVGDLNGDTLDDVVIGGWQGGDVKMNLTILIQNTDGTLTERTAEYLADSSYDGSQRLYIADFDNDGKADIFVPGYNENCTTGSECATRSFFLWGTGGRGVMTKQELPEYHSAHGACVDDLNSDGRLDVLVRGRYDSTTRTTTGSGAYINSGSRSFTLNSNILVGSTCSVIHDTTTGDVAILTANVNQTEGVNVISIYDSTLTWKYNIGVAGQNASATDLIGSLVVDDNGDGKKDFVLIYNPMAPMAPGAKEVWRWTAANTWTYATTIDTTYNNQYYTIEKVINGVKTVYFGASAGLYQYANGVWSLYKQSKFTDLARLISGSTSFGISAVYQNGSNGKTYMLQFINGSYYTQEL
jgi:hypothetical protein